MALQNVSYEKSLVSTIISRLVDLSLVAILLLLSLAILAICLLDIFIRIFSYRYILIGIGGSVALFAACIIIILAKRNLETLQSLHAIPKYYLPLSREVLPTSVKEQLRRSWVKEASLRLIAENGRKERVSKVLNTVHLRTLAFKNMLRIAKWKGSIMFVEEKNKSNAISAQNISENTFHFFDSLLYLPNDYNNNHQDSIESLSIVHDSSSEIQSVTVTKKFHHHLNPFSKKKRDDASDISSLNSNVSLKTDKSSRSVSELFDKKSHNFNSRDKLYTNVHSSELGAIVSKISTVYPNIGNLNNLIQNNTSEFTVSSLLGVVLSEKIDTVHGYPIAFSDITIDPCDSNAILELFNRVSNSNCALLKDTSELPKMEFAQLLLDSFYFVSALIDRFSYLTQEQIHAMVSSFYNTQVDFDVTTIESKNLVQILTYSTQCKFKNHYWNLQVRTLVISEIRKRINELTLVNLEGKTGLNSLQQLSPTSKALFETNETSQCAICGEEKTSNLEGGMVICNECNEGLYLDNAEKILAYDLIISRVIITSTILGKAEYAGKNKNTYRNLNGGGGVLSEVIPETTIVAQNLNKVDNNIVKSDSKKELSSASSRSLDGSINLVDHNFKNSLESNQNEDYNATSKNFDKHSKDNKSSIHSGSYSGSYSDSYSGSYSDSYSGSYSDSYSGSYSDSYSDSYSGSYSGSYSDSYSGSYSESYSESSSSQKSKTDKSSQTEVKEDTNSEKSNVIINAQLDVIPTVESEVNSLKITPNIKRFDEDGKSSESKNPSSDFSKTEPIQLKPRKVKKKAYIFPELSEGIPSPDNESLPSPGYYSDSAVLSSRYNEILSCPAIIKKQRLILYPDANPQTINYEELKSNYFKKVQDTFSTYIDESDEIIRNSGSEQLSANNNVKQIESRNALDILNEKLNLTLFKNEAIEDIKDDLELLNKDKNPDQERLDHAELRDSSAAHRLLISKLRSDHRKSKATDKASSEDVGLPISLNKPDNNDIILEEDEEYTDVGNSSKADNIVPNCSNSEKSLSHSTDISAYPNKNKITGSLGVSFNDEYFTKDKISLKQKGDTALSNDSALSKLPSSSSYSTTPRISKFNPSGLSFNDFKSVKSSLSMGSNSDAGYVSAEQWSSNNDLGKERTLSFTKDDNSTVSNANSKSGSSYSFSSSSYSSYTSSSGSYSYSGSGSFTSTSRSGIETDSKHSKLSEKSSSSLNSERSQLSNANASEKSALLRNKVYMDAPVEGIESKGGFTSFIFAERLQNTSESEGNKRKKSKHSNIINKSENNSRDIYEKECIKSVSTLKISEGSPQIRKKLSKMPSESISEWVQRLVSINFLPIDALKWMQKIEHIRFGNLQATVKSLELKDIMKENVSTILINPKKGNYRGADNILRKRTTRRSNVSKHDQRRYITTEFPIKHLPSLFKCSNSISVGNIHLNPYACVCPDTIRINLLPEANQNLSLKLNVKSPDITNKLQYYSEVNAVYNAADTILGSFDLVCDENYCKDANLKRSEETDIIGINSSDSNANISKSLTEGAVKKKEIDAKDPNRISITIDYDRELDEEENVSLSIKPVINEKMSQGLSSDHKESNRDSRSIGGYSSINQASYVGNIQGVKSPITLEKRIDGGISEEEYFNTMLILAKALANANFISFI